MYKDKGLKNCPKHTSSKTNVHYSPPLLHLEHEHSEHETTHYTCHTEPCQLQLFLASYTFTVNFYKVFTLYLHLWLFVSLTPETAPFSSASGIQVGASSCFVVVVVVVVVVQVPSWVNAIY